MRSIFINLVLVFFNLIVFSQKNNNMNLHSVDRNLEKKILNILKTPESAKTYLSIRLFPSQLFNDSIKNDLMYRDDFNDVISVLTLNMKEAVRVINKKEIEHWNLSSDEIFSLAKNQTKNEIKNVNFDLFDVNEKMKYYVVYDEANYFVNSLLYFPELLKKYDEYDKGIVIGIPVRHVCSVMPVISKEAFYEDLSVYYNFLVQIYSNENNPTTLNMYLLKRGSVYSISAIYDENNNFIKFLVPIELFQD